MNLLSVLKPLVLALEDDVRGFCEVDEGVHAQLLTEHQRAKDASRTALEFSAWRDEQVTVSAVQWVLACVFVRFCEDTGLIAEARLAGPGDRLGFATDTTTHFFQENPTLSEREYLFWVFGRTRELPGMRDLFDPDHNPLFKLPVSVDGAKMLLQFWRKPDPETGDLAVTFTDPDRDSRFLGDLYQDLSEAARKRYALLQTPEFIESFILDRTMEPAINEFGLADTDLIDPACGSGHFLLGAFDRLLAHWRVKEPRTSVRALCQRVLDQIAGVDLNPFAVAIAEFRLLVAALNASEVEELKDAPDFRFNLATGDSLLHGHRPGQLDVSDAQVKEEFRHLYEAEDEQKLRQILDHRYAAVVANPPYIVPADPAASQAYRELYASCHRQYALSVPFMERIFDLARPSDGRTPAGFTGQITSNSFMKREFGKKLIEEYLPNWDLTHLTDTSGAYIPGHGTPTVILFARAQAPRAETVRAVLGIRGEPSTPTVAAEGKVWTEITQLVDQPGSEGEFVSVEELDRNTLSKHPWSLQGGGALELMSSIIDESHALGSQISWCGRTASSGEDDVFVINRRDIARRFRVEDLADLVEGDRLREWVESPGLGAIWPYAEDGSARGLEAGETSFLWRFRTQLSRRTVFGSFIVDRGAKWWEWREIYPNRMGCPIAIAFSEVATHNHFAITRGERVFKQTAPAIALNSTSERDYFGILGPLNSVVALFWARQTFYPKGGYAGGQWENRLAWDATKLRKFPLPFDPPVELARRIDGLGQELSKVLPSSLFMEHDPSAELLEEARAKWVSVRRRMVALQEELDWRCYRLYGLIDEDLVFEDWDSLPEVNLGERAFEIALARKMEAGEVETRWFERHGSTPVTGIPDRLPEAYCELLQRRLDAIEENKSVRLIERPEYKRRWAVENAGKGRGWETEGWESMTSAALHDWICDRLESDAIWSQEKLLRADQISDALLSDQAFQEALVLYKGADVEPGKLVRKLLEEESVPYLASLRYKPSGMRKRAGWERTWDLQRAEDRGEKVEIDVPPKYKSTDFIKASFWKQRGKLDVPKERFTSYPGCASDGSDLYGWAGFDHAQRAKALATRIAEAQDVEGRPDEVILQMLAGLDELLPWVKQWNPDPDPEHGELLGDIYEAFLLERLQRLGTTRETLAAVDRLHA